MPGVAALPPLRIDGGAPLEEAEVALVESFADLPAGTWARARRLRWVVSLAAGADHVPFRDLPAGVRVVSLHATTALPVAEHAIALLLAAMKGIASHDRALRAGRFPQERESRQVAGARLLVLGAGAIGQEVARLAGALGMRVRVWRRGEDLDARLREAEAVVVALPLTRETKGLLDARRLALLPDDAIVVNVARGRIVDRAAMDARLAASPAFTYATDVWWRYPRGGAFEESVARRENVVGTPHVAALAPGWKEERLALALRVARELLEKGEPPAGTRIEDPAGYDGLR